MLSLSFMRAGGPPDGFPRVDSLGFYQLRGFGSPWP